MSPPPPGSSPPPAPPGPARPGPALPCPPLPLRATGSPPRPKHRRGQPRSSPEAAGGAPGARSSPRHRLPTGGIAGVGRGPGPSGSAWLAAHREAGGCGLGERGSAPLPSAGPAVSRRRRALNGSSAPRQRRRGRPDGSCGAARPGRLGGSFSSAPGSPGPAESPSVVAAAVRVCALLLSTI